MKKFFYLVTIVSICIGLYSCEEEDEKTPSELIIGTWRLTAATSSPAADWDGDGNPETDVFGAVYTEQCWRDDDWLFNSNNTLTVNPNILCQGQTAADYNVSATWSVPNDSQLVLTMDGDVTTHNNFSIDETTLSYSGSETFQGTSYTITYTYTKQ